MGRRNDLPYVFEKIHDNYRVPHLGIIITGIIILLLTIIGSCDFIVRAASFTILLYYSITNIAALKQLQKEQIFGRAIPVLGLLGCLLMSGSLPFNVIITGISLLIAGYIMKLIVNKTI